MILPLLVLLFIVSLHPIRLRVLHLISQSLILPTHHRNHRTFPLPYCLMVGSVYPSLMRITLRTFGAHNPPSYWSCIGYRRCCHYTHLSVVIYSDQSFFIFLLVTWHYAYLLLLSVMSVFLTLKYSSLLIFPSATAFLCDLSLCQSIGHQLTI